jgi:hypothetical protein
MDGGQRGLHPLQHCSWKGNRRKKNGALEDFTWPACVVGHAIVARCENGEIGDTSPKRKTGNSLHALRAGAGEN